jgi:hypothetical protein
MNTCADLGQRRAERRASSSAPEPSGAGGVIYDTFLGRRQSTSRHLTVKIRPVSVSS